jgi:tetratricopeptide (TPR) repeat protein
MNDDPVQAIESYRKAVAHSGDSPVVKPDLAYALVLADRREEALKILESLQKHAEEDYVAPYYLGQMYAGLGRADEAFAAFDRSLEERDWLLLWFDVSFFTVASELKTDPRWADLIERIDLLTK